MMKNLQNEVSLGWRRGLIAGALGVVLTAGGLGADPEEGLSANGPGGGVGTLPATQDDGSSGLPNPVGAAFGEASELNTELAAAAGVPALTLSGTSDELNALIALTYGPGGEEAPGWYELSSHDGIHTIAFHGPVVLLLDPGVLHGSKAVVGISVDPLGTGALSVRTPHGRVAAALTAGLNPLALHRAHRAGLLDAGLTVRTLGLDGQTTSTLRVQALGRVIRIEQLQ
jgi:hypothetical protein